MKVIDTVSEDDLIEVVQGRQDTCGIFNTLFVNGDAIYSFKTQLCIGYYLGKSGNKNISTFAENMIKYAPSVDYFDSNNKIGSYLRLKYRDRWEKIYYALVLDYDIKETTKMTTTHNALNSKTTTYNTTESTDENLYSNEETNQDLTVTRNEGENNDIYGFNSSSPVGDRERNIISSENTIANKDVNTNEVTQDNDYTKTKTGTDSDNISVNENETKTGHEKSYDEIIKSEIDMRNMYNLFDIIYSDIDKVMVSNII